MLIRHVDSLDPLSSSDDPVVLLATARPHGQRETETVRWRLLSIGSAETSVDRGPSSLLELR